MIETSEKEGVIVAQVKDSDRINAVVADQIKAELTEKVSVEGSAIVLNLSNIRFIDSTGIGVLISALKTARQNNSTFSLSGIQEDVLNLLKLMKLDKVFDII